MYTLNLKNFKAHIDLEVSFKNKNFLLYGDNGAGKSSLYEALKIVFYEEKIKSNLTSKERPEVHTAIIEEFWAQYKNKKATDSDSMNIECFSNSQKTQTINKNTYQVFMFGIDDLYFEKLLNIQVLLSKVFFDINVPTSDYSSISLEVNQLLKEKFLETIEIEIDEEDYRIKIKDTSKKIEFTKELKHYFNEAKLNLVILLLLFIIIKKYQDETKKRILILDDFITSLDVANRTFLMKYILDTFNQFQTIVLTHNVHFYNLIMYLIDTINGKKDKWQFANLYETNNKNKIYFNAHRIKIDDIKNANADNKGNLIRQKFERLLYEFSKILMIGSVEESNKILEILFNNKKKYLKKEGKIFKTSNDLVIEIEALLANNTDLESIKSLIRKYSEEDANLSIILDTIKELRIYQKVMMHSQSHGNEGINPIKEKEFEKTLELLEIFQSKIKDLQNKSVDGA